MASPDSRDMYSYSGGHGSRAGFKVEVENGYKRDRHGRVDSGTLYTYLTHTPPTGPALTKKGTVRVHQPPRHVDLTTSCYTAQMIHYGLKPFKTKPAAKKALLAAYAAQGGSLKVPQDMQRIEQEMEAEWEKKNDAANRLYEAEKQNRQGAERQQWIGRSLARGYDSDLDASDEDGDSEDAESDQDDEEEAQVAIRSKAEKSKKGSAAPKKGPVKTLKGAKLAKNIDTQGEFIITARAITDEWDVESDLILKICHSTTSTRIWGDFEFGRWTGNIRQTTTGLPEMKNDTITFLWRGRDEGGEGETSFGKNNIGSLTFLGGGKIKGKMGLNGVGEFTFTGKRDPERNVVWSMYAPEWKKAFRSVNQNNYDVANRRRWGGWGGEERDEAPADSDSDAGNGGPRRGR